jgi:hypothetical protein
MTGPTIRYSSGGRAVDMLKPTRSRWNLLALALNLGLIVALGACSDAAAWQQTVQACITEYAPEKGYGFVSEPPICASPPPPAPMSECPPITPQTISAQCSAAGAPCDADQFITRDAAMCIARAQGLADGLSPWTASLVFRVDSKRPFWAIRNVTKQEPGNCARSGNVALIDAITGAVAIGGWGEVC